MTSPIQLTGPLEEGVPVLRPVTPPARRRRDERRDPRERPHRRSSADGPELPPGAPDVDGHVDVLA